MSVDRSVPRSVLVRAAVTAGLLAALLLWLPTDALLSGLRRVSGRLWLGVFLGFTAGHGVAALKWRMVLAAAGLRASAGDALRAHGAGLFANLCLPSLVGGDVVRAGWLARGDRPLEAIAVAGLADRVIDTAAIVTLAAGAAALAPAALGSTGARALSAAALGLAGSVLVGWLLVRQLDARWLPARLAPSAGRLRAAAGALAGRPRVAAAALVLSLGIQAWFVLLNAALGRALGIEIALGVWFLVWPLAKLAALVPVSLGGIGVREAALAALLAPFAVAPALAVGQALVWESELVALGLVAGGLALAAGRLAGDRAPELPWRAR